MCDQYIAKVRAQGKCPAGAGIDNLALQPMTLDRFKTSGILQILTPAQAVAHFKAMQARMPVEHVMMMPL